MRTAKRVVNVAHAVTSCVLHREKGARRCYAAKSQQIQYVFRGKWVLKQVNCIILETEFNCEKYFCISIGQNLFYDFLHLRVWLPFINKIKRCQYNLFIRNVIIICFHKQLRNCNATAILWQAQLHDLSVKC